MQFLSPTQLILVLWLLATVAPAATVLLNGSMVPLPALALETSLSHFTGMDRTVKRSTAPVQVAARQRRVAPFSKAKVAVQLSTGTVEVAPAPAVSVVETAVQRRRPKVG